MTSASTGLTNEPTFALHDFHFYPEDLYGEPRNGPKYPSSLLDAPSTTIAFTVGCSHPNPIRIQSLALHVLEATLLKQSTFPISEGGGNGVTPVLGWVALEAKLGTYRVMTEARKTIGIGLQPADFHVRVFSKNGARFKISIEMEWMDLERQTQTYSHSFQEEFVADVPQMVEWQELASKAQKLRMLFSPTDLYFLKLRFNRLEVRDMTILCPYTEEFDLSKFREGMLSEGLDDFLQNNVVFVSQSQLSELNELVGTHDEPFEFMGPTRQFIVVDDKQLVLQNKDEFYLAEVIEDKERLNRVIQVFDDLAR